MHAGMPRKYKFYTPKYSQKKKTGHASKIVSIPLCLLKPVPVPSLEILSSILKSEVLPSGWIQFDASDPNHLVLAFLSYSSTLISSQYIIKINRDFTWQITSFGSEVSINNCQALSQAPYQFQSVAEVHDLINLIDKCHLCLGNPVDDFRALVDAHDGREFKDATGILVKNLLNFS